MRLNEMKAAASVALLLFSSTGQTIGQAAAQQTAPAPAPANTPANTPTNSPAQLNGGSPTNPTAPTTVAPTPQPEFPQAPDPKLTEPLFLRDTDTDYTKLKHFSFRHPLALYTSTDYPAPVLSSAAKLGDLLRDGKIYLSLNDAVTLALENNYDIAIARINLDIADTDLLRAKAGTTLRGVSTGLVTGTLGGTTSTITGGGGPGGTSSAAGGGGTGSSGLVLSTNGGGPTPEFLDPYITGTVQYERNTTPAGASLSSTTTASTTTGTGTTGTGTGTGTGTTGTGTGTSGTGTGTTTGLIQTTQTTTATALFDFTYNQGFLTGTQLTVAFDNSHVTTNSIYSGYNPALDAYFRATVTQHLLQGFGPKLNGRFILQAKNDRRITDSSFRQQVIYTITQVESIYWALVSAYEDEQSKERALNQSSQLTADNRKQLQIGTLAPLDVITSDSQVATDKQSLITSRSNLEYQQLLMKQALVQSLNDPALTAAPVVPTDRVGLDRLPQEDLPVDELVREAYINNPQIEQAALNMKNNEITIAAEKNGLLPTVDAYGFYGGQGVGGVQNANLQGVAPGTFPTIGYPTTLKNGLNNSAPDYGVGVNVQINLRNRIAQADQARSQMEYRQSQMRLEQLYTQIRIQVINAQYALTNDRANVQAAQVARDFNAQSLDAEQKKYKLGASTTANVLAQERTLATGENNLIAATAAYARDRAQLEQILSDTLERYNISLGDAATGKVTQKPNVPGLTPPVPPAPPRPLTADPGPPPA